MPVDYICGGCYCWSLFFFLSGPKIRDTFKWLFSNLSPQRICATVMKLKLFGYLTDDNHAFSTLFGSNLWDKWCKYYSHITGLCWVLVSYCSEVRILRQLAHKVVRRKLLFPFPSVMRSRCVQILTFQLSYRGLQGNMWQIWGTGLTLPMYW